MTFFKQVTKVLSLQAGKLGGTLIFYAIQQIVISLGITIGFTFLYADVDKSTLLYLATGAPTMIFIMCGFAALPFQNSAAKTEGHITFLKTLPINRFAIILADTIIWLCVAMPGIVISTLCAHLLYSPGYSFSFTVIPACLLSAVTCIAIGYGFSYVLKPENTMLVCMLCVFGGLMFSPVNFPLERLPAWLQAVHRILPVDAMAKIIRASFAKNAFSADLQSYLLLICWCIAGYSAVAVIINKR
ncbi:MAG: ABC transporter permease [Lachnospiraceae bacterium]|nr:ABC transporter permease [Lachnospiraceae bacterium]